MLFSQARFPPRPFDLLAASLFAILGLGCAGGARVRAFAREGMPWRSLAAVIAGLVLMVLPARATLVLAPDFSTMVNGSDYIVHTVVRSVTSEKQVTSHGATLVTHVDLTVLEVVAGDAPSTVTLELLGGQVGDETLTVEGMPKFHVGDEDILFVAGNGRSICPLYGMMHGRYAVVQEPASGRKYIARTGGVPLLSTADIATPLSGGGESRVAAAIHALSPAEFIRQIRAAVQPDGHLARAK